MTKENISDLKLRRKEYWKRYYSDPKVREHKKEYRKKYYSEHKKELLAKVKEWNIENREKRNLITLRYYYHNKERFAKQRSRWKEQFPEKVRESQRKSQQKWRSINIKSKIKDHIGSKIRGQLKKITLKKHQRLEEMLGYSIIELENHLNKTMPQGYSWNDYLNGKLHIDHIIPIAVFDFISPNDLAFKQCWALSNLRLLPAKENLSKGAKLIHPFIPPLSLAMNQ